MGGVEMAKSISSIKKTTTGTGKLIKRVAAIIFSAAVIIVSFIYLNNADRAARDTVTVVRIKSADLPAYSVISKENVEKYDVIKKEYEGGSNGMVLFEDIENIYGLVSAYFIRGGTYLYKNQLIEKKPQRNEWLYELTGDYEVLTIPYNYMEAGGEILLPGDQIRIRVIYEGYEEQSEDDYYDTNPNYGYSGNKIIKSEILFDSIVVRDMINSNARSIYEIYSEVMRLGEKERREVMKSSGFMSSIKPKSLLLEASADQIDAYALYKKTAGAGNFLITILSRSGGRVILDQLPMLESEVSSWLS